MTRLICLLTLLLAAVSGAAEIAGVVVDEQGNPIKGAVVDVWSWYPGNEATTDKDGHFSIKNLDDRDPVELKITKDGFSPYYNENEATGNTDARYTLSNKTFFEGTVLSPDGKPVPNVAITGKVGEKVNKNVHITSVQLKSKSDKDGHYKFFCWPDNYEFQIRVPGVGVLRSAGNIVAADEGKQMDLKLEPPISLKVVTVDSESGTPIEGAKISGVGGAGGSATTGKDGIAEVPDLLPGNISLNVRAKGYARWWTHDQRKQEEVYYTHFVENNNSIQVDVARDMAPVQIDLEKGVTITGKVVDPDDKPLSGATVAPVTIGSGDTITSDTRYNVTTKKDGSFATTLPASLDQQYLLIAHDGAGEKSKARKWANGRSQDMQTKPGEEIKDVVIKLTKGGTVKGHLLKSNGDPAPNQGVRAMPADWNDTRYLTPEAKTDKDGNFEIKNVAPGDQLIQCPPWWMETKYYKPEQSVQVTVTEGETVEGVELKLREGD